MLVLILIFALMTGFSIRETMSGKSNIVFVLTDDQDLILGGQIPIVKTNKLIGDHGMLFNSMYVASPLCCPSRSSILTGKYVSSHKAYNNSIVGGCSSPEWQKTQEIDAFPVYMKNQSYTTFFAGKYLNQYGFTATGGVEHIPPGWDWWNGLVGNSRYYNYHLSVNGTKEAHGSDPNKDYLTDLINRRATEFLYQQSTEAGPFFMMLSTPASHAPFTPAPKYKDNFADKQAPRTSSYNIHGKDKHWLIEQALNPMPNDTVTTIDDIFRNRWRTLLSVDDMVENVVDILTEKDLINNTFIFFTSDNGYHLGQFSLPNDKRQLYEFDNRVPFMVRGPGIKSGSTYNSPVSSIDLAPTFLEIAESTIPITMQGESLLKLLTTQNYNRSSPILLEHYGEHKDEIHGCPQYTNQGMANCDNHCVCEDSHNNTFRCWVMWGEPNIDKQKLCYVMEDNETFVELYDLVKDENELNNIIDYIDKPGFEKNGEMIKDMKNCKKCQHVLKFIEDCRGHNCEKIINLLH
ncbi:N-acetylglucosamine-6-sulfatase-like isoform X1 [Mytilus edulis]|uniref:N-acetylglucosamine-6-sulfatase-like isoform X1 n=2 Tax=Mytilus edulis TaxID=6550 RepID=UPI0039EE174B